MEQETRDYIYRLLDRHRSKGLLSPLQIFAALKAEQVPFKGLEVAQLLAQTNLCPNVTFPTFLVDFVVQYLRGTPIQTVLDPWAGLGLLLIPVVQSTTADRIYGIAQTPQEEQITREIYNDQPIIWTQGNTIDWLDNNKERFDLVVSFPPLSGLREDAIVSSPDGSLEIKDSLGHLILMKACQALAEHGVGIFIVDNRFSSQSNPKSVCNNMGKLGLTVDAMLALPQGAFHPHFSLPTSMIIVRSSAARRMFVGELSDDPKRNAILLSNLTAHKPGKDISLGALVDPASFQSYQALVADRQFQEMVRHLGLPATTVAEVSTEINRTKAINPPGFKDQSNAVYLPVIGRGPAVTSLDALTLKPHNYIQLVLDPSRAIAPYIAGFLNSPIGDLARKRVLSGDFIPRISKSSVQHLQPFIPDVEVQLRSLEADTQISSVMSSLQDLRARIWSQPRKLDNVFQGLKHINREERFTDWLDTLPFPLASILWAYHANKRNHEKSVEHLYHFFEALAQFYATLLLSGFHTAPEIFQSLRTELASTLQVASLADALEHGSFGVWSNITAYCAKQARAMLSGASSEQTQCKELFRTVRRDVLDMLFSSKLTTILQATNSLRNTYKGHGGISSEKAAHEQQTLLEHELARVRQLFGETWENYQLIIPGVNTFDGGQYDYRVQRLMGTRTPFETISLKTSTPMVDRSLYLLAPGEVNPLKLMPFIKVMASPRSAQNASYFYNRIQRGRIRYVSYHFEAEAEVEDTFPETADLLERLR